MGENGHALVPEKVYLSDVEIHRQSPYASPADLRARVLLHILFSDELLIGDSQCLNTPMFRVLVAADEDGPGSVRADLGTLLDLGRIRVARRDGQPLSLIREAQQLRRVEHVPSARYAEDMDRRTARYALSYDFDAVAAAFKSGVLRLLRRQLAHTRGVTRATLERALEWAADQEPLFYKAIKDWGDAVKAESDSTPVEVVHAVQTLDRAAGEAYRQALPTVLGAGTAGPRGDGALARTSTNEILLDRASLPAGILDEFLLGRVPVEIVLEATEQAGRAAVVRELAVLRSGRQPDLALLADAMTEFGAWMQEAFNRAFRNTDERALAVLRAERNLMRFGITHDSLTGTLGAGLDVAPSDAGADAYFDVRFLEHGIPAADEPAAPEPFDSGRLRQRAVTGSSRG